MKIDRKAVYDKYNGHCAYCGCEIELRQMQVDHIRCLRNFYTGKISEIPQYHHNDIQNLNPACRVCNNWKSSFSIETFRSELEKQLERVRLNSANYRIALKYGLIQETPKPIIFYFEQCLKNLTQ